MSAAIGWDDARTARAYERFCRRHSRYRLANEALVVHAALADGHRVLDVAAGTGRTAEAALKLIGSRGTIVCVEPATAMRDAGATRIRDPRVEWTAALPPAGTFDRVLCGAAIWQMFPLDAALERLGSLLAPSGALAFNIPAAYLLEPDRGGGGRDPFLLALAASIRQSPKLASHAIPSFTPTAADVERMLAAAGFRAERWSFDVRLTQSAYRDWLKIPPVSEGLFAGVDPEERARRLDDAYRRADRRSWKWERWTGWTAWRMR
ncbi:MAG: methyltransferase domain-containing protein [Gemmatimonadaceae bacterium]